MTRILRVIPALLVLFLALPSASAMAGKDVKTPAGAEQLKESLEKHAPAAAK
jgi:hypothetical protein